MITCNNLYKSFGDFNAVDGISFSIPAGGCWGLLGPNGAGKTTLIRMMIGLLEPTGGDVVFDGLKMQKDAISVKSKIGVVSQHMNLDKELTVEENLKFSGLLYHMPKDEIRSRTQELLSFLELEKARKRLSKHLSGGMKRKLMIARAIMHDPQYIFLDEPTAGVDASARKEIWDFLKSQHESGKTIVLTTHYIEEAQRLCDNVMLINEGKIFKDGSPSALIDSLGRYKLEYQADGQCLSSFHETLSQAKDIAIGIDTGYNITDTSLEDVFFSYTQKKVHIWK